MVSHSHLIGSVGKLHDRTDCIFNGVSDQKTPVYHTNGGIWSIACFDGDVNVPLMSINVVKIVKCSLRVNRNSHSVLRILVS